LYDKFEEYCKRKGIERPSGNVLHFLELEMEKDDSLKEEILNDKDIREFFAVKPEVPPSV
jgi:hypothetical protein